MPTRAKCELCRTRRWTHIVAGRGLCVPCEIERLERRQTTKRKKRAKRFAEKGAAW